MEGCDRSAVSVLLGKSVLGRAATVTPGFLQGNSFNAATTRAAKMAITLNIAFKMNHLEA